MYPIYPIITTELWECVVLSLFDALAKHPHQSVWKKLISNWYFPQRALGEKPDTSPDAQNRHLVIVRLRVTSTDDHGRWPARLGSWWWWWWWYIQATGRKSRTIFEVRQSALRVDAGLPFSGNTGLWKVLRKLDTLRKGLAKAENNFRALKVYGSDSKHMLADMISAKAEKNRSGREDFLEQDNSAILLRTPQGHTCETVLFHFTSFHGCSVCADISSYSSNKS